MASCHLLPRFCGWEWAEHDCLCIIYSCYNNPEISFGFSYQKWSQHTKVQINKTVSQSFLFLFYLFLLAPSAYLCKGYHRKTKFWCSHQPWSMLAIKYETAPQTINQYSVTSSILKPETPPLWIDPTSTHLPHSPVFFFTSSAIWIPSSINSTTFSKSASLNCRDVKAGAPAREAEEEVRFIKINKSKFDYIWVITVDGIGKKTLELIDFWQKYTDSKLHHADRHTERNARVHWEKSVDWHILNKL